MGKSIHLFAIDVQNDFCNPNGALYVPGADEDTKRLSAMVNRIGDKLDDIHVTLDSHQVCHIAHPVMWVDANGKNPDPFTIISLDDVEKGIWNPASPVWRDIMLNYVRQLATNQRYLLCIWPPHCIIGSWGHSLVPEFSDAICKWQEKNHAWVNYITKGSNPWTEHYSAVQADVPHPRDPSTQLNQHLIDILGKADLILITGQALSHCVANTITDVANNFGEENIKKFVLLEDTCSNVPTFDQLGEDFVKSMIARGMQTSKSTEILT